MSDQANIAKEKNEIEEELFNKIMANHILRTGFDRQKGEIEVLEEKIKNLLVEKKENENVTQSLRDELSDEKDKHFLLLLVLGVCFEGTEEINKRLEKVQEKLEHLPQLLQEKKQMFIDHDEKEQEKLQYFSERQIKLLENEIETKKKKIFDLGKKNNDFENLLRYYKNCIKITNHKGIDFSKFEELLKNTDKKAVVHQWLLERKIIDQRKELDALNKKCDWIIKEKAKFEKYGQKMHSDYLLIKSSEMCMKNELDKALESELKAIEENMQLKLKLTDKLGEVIYDGKIMYTLDDIKNYKNEIVLFQKELSHTRCVVDRQHTVNKKQQEKMKKIKEKIKKHCICGMEFDTEKEEDEESESDSYKFDAQYDHQTDMDSSNYDDSESEDKKPPYEEDPSNEMQPPLETL